jgi:putative DNA primase/helicase
MSALDGEADLEEMGLDGWSEGPPAGRFDDAAPAAGHDGGRDRGVTGDCSDLRNAERLVALFGDDLRYVHAWKAWLVWDGRRWAVDDTGAALRRASDTARLMLKEALDTYGERSKELVLAPKDEKAQKAEKAARAGVAWALRSQSVQRLGAMLDIARSFERIAIRHEELDADPWVLNVANGVIDLRTGRLLPHDRARLLTKMADVAFNPKATCPAWTRFLGACMGGKEDLTTFLARMVGYALTGDTGEHALFFLFGDGRNGKSTFLTTLAAVLGAYATAAPRGMLFRSGADRHPTELTCLHGARFVSCAEIEQGKAFDEALVKDLTGGDTITARRMNQDFWSFRPSHKLFIAGNHKPVVRGDDDGIWRRLRLVPWLVQVAPEDVDRGLADKLRAEAAGILAWAVRGCLDWQKNGLGEPRAVLEATASYREESDPLGDFFVERLVFEPGTKTPRALIRGAYDAWAKENGVRAPLGHRSFAAALHKRAVTDGGTMRIPSKSSPVDAWVGVRLRRDDEARRVPANVASKAPYDPLRDPVKEAVGMSISLSQSISKNEIGVSHGTIDREVTTTRPYGPTLPWFEDDDYDPSHVGSAE